MIIISSDFLTTLTIRRQRSNVYEVLKENYVESRLLALVQPMKKTNTIKKLQTHEREN